LEARGFIRVTSGKKPAVMGITREPLFNFFFRVANFGEDSYRELMEIRKALEIQSAMLAAERRTDEEMKRITAIVAAMGRYLYQVDKFSELDLELHLQIAQASHNKIMVHLIGSLRDAIRQAIVASTTAMLQTRGDLARVGQRLHLEIIKQLQSRNPQGAGEAMRQHWSEMESLLESDSHRHSKKVTGEPRVPRVLPTE
jgi:GntR family transcriptional regulator, transcriptional repressor for pyruvate dehydrogenase complex